MINITLDNSTLVTLLAEHKVQYDGIISLNVSIHAFHAMFLFEAVYTVLAGMCAAVKVLIAFKRIAVMSWG